MTTRPTGIAASRVHLGMRATNGIALVLVLGSALVVGACRQPEPPPVLPDDVELHLVEDASGRPVAIDATGLEPELIGRLESAGWGEQEWSGAFAVHVDDGGPDAERTGVAGEHLTIDRGVRFLPAEPFARGVRYVATWKALQENELAFEPRRDGPSPTTQVTAIYPSADLLPQNVARLHVQFTKPMGLGGAGSFVRIHPEKGGPPLDAFTRDESAGASDVIEEWSEDGKRLTLSFARDAEGRPRLEIASRYRLVVDRGWLDAEGIPLRDTFEKVFAISKNDRVPPDPTAWKVTPPVSKAAPLVVDFPAPLDHVRLESGLAVLSQEEKLAGNVRISNEERRWVFSPEKPWSNGRYVVRIVRQLEDPSGNVLGGGQAATAETGAVVPFLVDVPEKPARQSRRGG